MTKDEILKTALRQSALDLGCAPEDFLKSENVAVISRANPKARKYLTLPFVCGIVSYGKNAVASCDEKYVKLVKDYMDSFTVYHLFETPNLNVLAEKFRPEGMKICFMAEYFLPDPEKTVPLPCPYELKFLGQKDFGELYLPEWSNALCKERKELDVLGIGAYDGEKLVGLAGCSADCDEMLQIGIDVLPEYRNRGIASALTSALSSEIMNRGKVPFYCAAWSNVASVRNAIRSGFRPAWVEISVKPDPFVDGMNRINH